MAGGLGSRNDISDIVVKSQLSRGKKRLVEQKVGSYAPDSHNQQQYYGSYDNYIRY